MDETQKNHLQKLLTIADTIHDFCNMGRYPKDELPGAIDRKKVLKERITASLLKEFFDIARVQVEKITRCLDVRKSQKMLVMYEEAFEEVTIPKFMQNEDEVFEIVKSNLASHGYDYVNEGAMYHKLVIDRGEMTAEVLYEMLSNLSGRRFVKYVLDKNNTDNTLFCVDSKIIKHTTNVTTIDKIIRPFIFKSMYKGLFDDFDYQRNKVDTRKNNSNNNNNNNSNTNNATLSDAKIAAKKLLNCCHKDHTEYSMRKEDQETMVLTEIGVKHNAMLNRNVGPSRTQKPAYGLYISHTDRDKVVNVPVRFQNDTNSSIDNNSGEGGKKESKGLTLFLRTIIQLGTDDLRTLQMVALRSIDNIFSLRCDRFPTMYADAAIDTFVSLSQVRFVKALYDLKRAGDYLPVKATRNANIAFAHHDTIYFYVSSDRLAVAYALLQGCPCIHVVNGGNDFKIYNPRGQVMVGGRGSISSGKKTVARRPPTTTNRRNEEEMLSYDLYMRMRLDDLVPESPSSEFEAFLVRYRHAFDETYMTYFWYVVYRFLFFLQFPA